jgi:hypothetical protein
MSIRHCLFICWLIALASGLVSATAASAERTRGARAAAEPPPEETPKPPPPKRADLAVEDLRLSSVTIDARTTKIRVRVRNVGSLTAQSTGLIVACALLDGSKRRNCPGSNPPARFHVPSLAVNAERTFELPVRRFLLPAGQPGQYEIAARLDTQSRVSEDNEYNNSRVLKFQR